MAWTGYKTFGSNGSLYNEWLNASRLSASDNSRCTAQDLQLHSFTNFGYTTSDIPSGYIINKVEISLEGRVAYSGDQMQIMAQYIKSGVLQSGYDTYTFTLTSDRTFVLELDATEMGNPTDSDARASDSGINFKAFELTSMALFLGDYMKIRYDISPPATRRVMVIS